MSKGGIHNQSGKPAGVTFPLTSTSRPGSSLRASSGASQKRDLLVVTSGSVEASIP